MNTIISLLSDQLIPNVLFIKQMSKRGDRHIFITTREMARKQKSSVLADTLGLQHSDFKTLEIDSNKPLLILEALNNFSWPNGENYIVNITGGTKMMSQATFLFFSQKFLHKDKTEVFYWPIGEKVLEQLHPHIREIKIDAPHQLDLKTYIHAHGFDYMSQKELSFPFSQSDSLFNKVVQNKSADKVTEISQAKAEDYSHPDKGYYLGAWFEEWLYYFLKTELNLRDSQIAFNLKLKNRQSIRETESDNEIDVAFVFDNKLFIWECKVLYSKSATGKKIAEAIYKISSVSQSLGLQATSLVAILAPFGNNSKRQDFLKDITKIMRVKSVFSLEDMGDKNKFLKLVRALIR
ncbi:MAG: DUF1887 family protein [Bacteroidetes bacterium]|nr:DUF1887 family protein [Bacteroidota bacterium]